MDLKTQDKAKQQTIRLTLLLMIKKKNKKKGKEQKDTTTATKGESETSFALFPESLLSNVKSCGHSQYFDTRDFDESCQEVFPTPKTREIDIQGMILSSSDDKRREGNNLFHPQKRRQGAKETSD